MTQSVAELLQENQSLKRHIALLEERLRLADAKRFGASSEKANDGQLGLFNDAEQTQSEATPWAPDDECDAVNVTVVGEHTHKTPGRKPLPDHLPHLVIEHDLSEDAKVCACGWRKTKIGEEVSEQLDIIPARIQVLRHVRFKYACRACEGTDDDGPTVMTAPLPPQPIPKSNASPGLLAYIVTAKFCDGLPLYRLEKMFPRVGVTVLRATMAYWMIRCGDLVEPLIAKLHAEQMAHDIIQMDETTVQVLKEKGRYPQSQSYMWVMRGGPPDKPVTLFDYEPSRGGNVPARLLANFHGFLQTDGYEGYAAVAKRNDIISVGCLAHARRKFDDALKAQKKKGRGGLAKHGFDFIQRLYRVEREARERGLDANQRKALRNEKARPVWDELHQWLDGVCGQVSPKSLTGKALNYTKAQLPRLVRTLDDGRIEVDNNHCENAIRPFVLGRKAWLFADTPTGATASARLYSLIETAKANRLEPYTYLARVFEELPAAIAADDDDAINRLLPWNVAATDA
ncbi:MAG: IS66 family transposase [Hyphomicrobiaceae bacterium]